MFLELVKKRNPKLIDIAFFLHNQQKLLPDTYLIDGDIYSRNVCSMVATAKKYNIELYAMTKQFGRVPILAQRAVELGMAGIVCVDYQEALTMARNNIKIGHVGHLCQIPTAALGEILEAKPEVVTIYSYEKAVEINRIVKKQKIKQSILIKVFSDEDIFYPQQYAGFHINDLDALLTRLSLLDNIIIAGVTHFPCFLYDKKEQRIIATSNARTVVTAAQKLKQKGYKNLQVNLPSSTCCNSIPLLAGLGGTHGEPGHGLLGTTPYHAENSNSQEVPAIIYLSEVSHTINGKSYCYGGGYYRRSHLKFAFVGDTNTKVEVSVPVSEAIDYYFELNGEFPVGTAVVMSFRTQVFVTRSQVAVIDGITKNKAHIISLTSSLGVPV